MERADVIILGGGLVGLTLAIALDRHGLSSIVVDPADPEKVAAPSYDGRATAVASVASGTTGPSRRRSMRRRTS